MKNCKKFLIADSLKEWSKESITEFIETSDNKELLQVAKENNILLPSPDISLFKTIYARVDIPNRNNVIISKQAAVKGLPTLIKKSINLEHLGSGYICGFILDAKIENDFIIIYGCFYKSLFQDKFEQLKKAFKTKDAAVSFEIWNRDEKGESVIRDLDNGIREINPVLFHGCGLLLESEPACKEAYLSKLIASEKKIFDENLIYAAMVKDELNCTKKCENCTCKGGEKMEEVTVEKVVLLVSDYEEGDQIEEAKKLTPEQRNALPDEDFALIQKKDGKKVRRFPIHDEAHVRNALARLSQAKDISEEEKNSALAKMLKKAKEFKMDELLKNYATVEEVVVEPKVESADMVCMPVNKLVNSPTIVKIIEEENYITITINGKEERKGVRKITTELSDGTKQEESHEFNFVDMFTQAQIDEKIATVKAELETKLVEKDNELSTLKAEKELEVTKIKAELDLKNQEIDKLKIESAKKVEEPKKEVDLTVGNVEAKKEEDRYKEIRAKIDKRAFKSTKKEESK